MYGHGFGLLFPGPRCMVKRKTAIVAASSKDVLTRAVTFIGKAQSSRGGWYYTSAADGHDMDEGSVNRDAGASAARRPRTAGIVVPKSIIDKAVKYLENSHHRKVAASIYSPRFRAGWASGGRRSTGTHGSGTGVRAERRRILGSLDQALAEVLARCIFRSPMSSVFGHDEYTHYYFRSMSSTCLETRALPSSSLNRPQNETARLEQIPQDHVRTLAEDAGSRRQLEWGAT